jgi:hypothetical protein
MISYATGGQMKIPKICTKSASFDRSDAGWYSPNSVNVRDIRPDWRYAGGGVSEQDLSDLPTAIDRAIAYTKPRIEDATRHLKELEAAKIEVHNVEFRPSCADLSRKVAPAT